jgi:hypothetical protein
VPRPGRSSFADRLALQVANFHLARDVLQFIEHEMIAHDGRALSTAVGDSGTISRHFERRGSSG